jgi:hypothetical protein
MEKELPADTPTAPPAPEPPPRAATTPDHDPAAHDVAFRSGDDVQFSTTGQVTIPIDAKVQHEGSVSLWVQPGWQPDNEDDAMLVQLGDRLRVAKNVDSLRLEAADAKAAHADETADVVVPISEWNPGEWHRVTATWSKKVLSLYVDGELVGRQMRRGDVDLPADRELRVGSDLADSRRVAPGLIGRVDLRTRALGDDEVAKDFRDALGDVDGRRKGSAGGRKGSAGAKGSAGRGRTP